MFALKIFFPDEDTDTSTPSENAPFGKKPQSTFSSMTDVKQTISPPPQPTAGENESALFVNQASQLIKKDEISTLSKVIEYRFNQVNQEINEIFK